MRTTLIVIAGTLISIASLFLAIPLFGLFGETPNKIIYSIYDSYFVVQDWGFVLIGLVMGTGPSILAYFYPRTRIPLVTSVIVLATLVVVLSQLEEPDYVIGAALEFLPLFAIGASVPFYLSYLFGKRI